MTNLLARGSSSFHYQWTYDVFINFRGEDTRHGFIGHLYKAMKDAGVRAFLDGEELGRGDEIRPTLLNAIVNSRMAITVFSKNYASSTFCLDELVKIRDCIKKKGRLVWPIFYDVEPSEVRHQKGNYEQVLSMHIKNRRADEDKIQSWKLALHEVANISGHHFDPTRHGYEYQFIDKIVKEISSKINRVPLHVCEYPVGLKSRVEEVSSLLQMESNEKVIMVGMCGMGGLGKTTLARALYNSIADNFEALCFLHDVKGKSKILGLEKIQETILSKIVGVDIKIEDVNEGVEVMKMRLKQKKILLILDNIDKHEQLKKLSGGCNWFSCGSRIIITTRDQHLLVRHGVESIYNMKTFNYEESLELLKWNAFRNNQQVDPSYNNVLNHAIAYAEGLPLALEVVGSNLCGKPIYEWDSALATCKLIPHKDIQQVLKVSYEGLGEVEKEIFLDIACFWNREKLEYVKYVEEAVHGVDNLRNPISVLVDKCLIKIDDGDIHMHDLIQDMGREIVREESPKRPGERSRLWLYQDIVDVLEGNKGTKKIRMIVQGRSRCMEVNWDGEAFKDMKELEVLSFEDVKFSEDPKYLPGSLKVLNWKEYSSSRLPPSFSGKKLTVLNIRYSCLSSLETIMKTSENLAMLNLEGCKYVKEIPDLWNLINLKELNLRRCWKLTEIHDSIGYLPKLEILDVSDCSELKIFPHAISLPSLRRIDVSYCSSLKYFPEILGKVKIKNLYLEQSGIEKLPQSIYNLSELRELKIQNYLWYQPFNIEIPSSIFHLPEIEEISVSCVGKVVVFNSEEAQEQAICSKQCPNKVFIDLPRCNISDDVLRSDLSRFMNVTDLNLSSNDFTILPAWIKECQFLKSLWLNNCKHLKEVEGIPPHLRVFEARNCASLSLESKSLLLSEEIHLAAHKRYNDHHDRSKEDVSYYFCLPSRSIPKWFHHQSKGASISFWSRNSFPYALYLCVLKPKDAANFYENQYHPPLDVEVRINNGLVYERFCGSWHYVNDDHLFVCYLSLSYKERLGFWRKKNWNHVLVSTYQYPRDENPKVIKGSAIHVVCDSMQDVTFQNPYHHQTLDKEGALDNFASPSSNANDDEAITPQIINNQDEDEDEDEDDSTIDNQEFQQPENVTSTNDVEQVPRFYQRRLYLHKMDSFYDQDEDDDDDDDD